MKVLRATAWVLGGLLVSVPVLLAVLLVGVQFDPLGTALANRVGGFVIPTGSTLHVRNVSGSWVGGLHLRGVRWTRGADTVVVDTAVLDWSPFEWRPGRIVIAQARVEGVRARLAVGAGGRSAPGFDPSSTTRRPTQDRSADSAGTGWVVQVDELTARDAEARLHGSAGVDSDPDPEPYRIADLAAGGTSVQIVPRPGVDSLALEGSFAPPGQRKGWGQARLVVRYRDEVLHLDTLAIDSPGSLVAGRGRIDFDALMDPGAVQWNVRAEPLVLDDLVGLGFLPPSLAGDTLRLFTRARADGSGARIDLDARSSGADSVAATWRWEREGDEWAGHGSVRLTASASTGWPGLAGLEGPVEAEVQGRARGSWPPALPGTRPAGEAGGRRGSDLRGEARLDARSGRGLVSGRLSVEPRPAPASGDSLTLRLDTLAWDRVALAEAVLTLTRPSRAGADRPLEWSLEGRPGSEGRVRGTGRLVPGAPNRPLGYAGDLDLRKVTDPYAGSLVNGTIRFEGSGTRLMETVLEADLDLADSRLATLAVDTAQLRVRWEEGEARVAGSADTERGGGAVDVVASATEEGGTFEVEPLRLDSLSVAGQGDSTSVQARARARGRWTGGPLGFVDPRQVTARMDVTSGRARVGGVSVDSLRIIGDWEEGRLGAEARVALPDSGRVVLRGEGALLDSLGFTLSEGRFTGLNLREVVAGSPRTRLQGTVTGRYEGARTRIQGELRLDRSLALGDTIRSARIQAQGGPERVEATLTSRLAGGTLEGRLTGDGLSGPGRVSDRGDGMPDPGSGDAADEGGILGALGSWTLELEGDLPRVGGFLGQADTTVGLRFVAEGRGGPGGGADLEARVQDARGWGVRFDTAVFAGRLEDGLLVVDTLGLESDWIRGGGHGELPLALASGDPGDALAAVEPGHRLEVRFAISDSAPTHGEEADERLPAPSLRSDLRARAGSLEVATECTTVRCDVRGGLALESVLFRSYSVATAEVALDAEVRAGLDVSRGEGTLSLVGVRTPTASVRAFDLTADARGDLWHIEANALIDEDRDARLEVELDPGPGRARIRDLAFRMDEDRWRLREPGSVRYGAAGIRIDTLEVAAGDQRVLVGGRWNAGDDGTDLILHLDSVRVGTVSDLAGAPGLDGWIDLQLLARGPEGEPRFEGTASGFFDHEGEPLHRFEIEGDQQSGLLTLQMGLSDPSSRERLRASGDIPLGGGDREWALEIAADSLPLRWAEPYLPGNLAQDLSGSVDAEVRVEGPRSDPRASGPLVVDSARVGLPVAGITLTGTHLDASLDGGRLAVRDFEARSVGTLRGSGEFRLPTSAGPGELDLDLEADDFIAVNTSALRTVVEGTGRVEGTLARPDVSAAVTVPEAVVRLDEAVLASGVDDVTLSDRDWQTLRTRFGILPPEDRTGSSPLFQAMALDLEVELGRDLWVRQQANPEMRVQFTGAFTTTKESGSEQMDLRGDLEAIPQRSFVEQFGRRFELEEGTARLQGPADETRIDVTSVYRVPPREGTTSEVSVSLSLTGRPGDLSLTLSSTPSMENADIVSYLATGRPASQACGGRTGDGTSAGELGTDLVASQLTAAVEEFALRNVGLDVLEIQREGLREATLVAGQYVTPELFLGFRQPVAFGSDETSGPSPEDLQAQLEWQAYRWLLLHLETGGSAFRFFLEGSYGY